MLPALSNFSPFRADVAAVLDPHARQHYLVVLSATFEAQPGKSMRIAEEQTALADIDVHFGDPATSSVKYDADYAFEKPGVDVVVNGSAYAPNGRPTSHVQVGIRVGGVLEKKAQSAGRKILPRVALQSAAFVSASVGFALDSKRPNSIRSFPNFGSLVNVPAIG